MKKQRLKLTVFKDRIGEWRWSLSRGNHILACSSESYQRRCTMLRTVNHLFASIKAGEVFEIA